MRIHGTLIKWNDDRGFGFVALPSSNEEIFVHISAFPRDGVRPRIGETISFEVRTAPDGRKRAEIVERAAVRNAPRRRKTPTRDARRSWVSSLLSSVAILAVGFVGYNLYTAARRDADTAPSILPAVDTAAQLFRCDGRTHCSQMTSCAEAEYFLKHCPGVQMDGNGDGEPCEQQWCN
jgi:cold shock CspA family protein